VENVPDGSFIEIAHRLVRFRSILSSRDFATSLMEQSHNHIKRFEGLVLPDGLEELFLVRSTKNSFPCVIHVAARHQLVFTELQLHSNIRRCCSRSALELQDKLAAHGENHR
jgi:hypothetical protein